MRKIFCILLLFCLVYAEQDNISRYVAVAKEFEFQEKRNIHYPLTIKPVAGTKYFDIYYDDVSRQKYYKIATVSDLAITHPHPCEYQNGVLYVLRVTEVIQGKKIKKNLELWVYTKKVAKQIFTAERMSFRAAGNGQLVAVAANNSLVFFDKTGQKLKVFKTIELGEIKKLPTVLALSGWSSDSQYLWGYLSKEKPLIYFSVKPSNWAVEKFPLAWLNITREYLLNPDLRQLAYTTTLTEVIKKKKTKKVYGLYYYDLTEKKLGTVVTTNREILFYPRWKENNVSFISPEGKRVLFSPLAH